MFSPCVCLLVCFVTLDVYQKKKNLKKKKKKFASLQHYHGLLFLLPILGLFVCVCCCWSRG